MLGNERAILWSAGRADGPGAAQFRSEERLAWPDMAKAMAIILVVLMHCYWMTYPDGWRPDGAILDHWLVINDLFLPLRMPLFFLVSGILASNSIMRCRADSRRKRLLKPLYLYVVWGMIFQALIPISPHPTWLVPGPNNNFLVIGKLDVSAWYMAALAIFYAITKITLRLPVWLMLLLCAGLSVVGTFYKYDLPGYNYHQLLRCMIFFVAGVRLKGELLAFVDEASARRATLFIVAYLAGAVALLPFGTYLLPVDMLAVAAGATLCGLAATRLPRLAFSATWLARRTLPIYLVHFILLWAVMVNLPAIVPPCLLDSLWFGLAFPLVAVPLLIGCSLLTHQGLQRLGVGFLFDLPSGADVSDPSAVQRKKGPGSMIPSPISQEVAF